jgi:Ca-activated chloride channel homolog
MLFVSANRPHHKRGTHMKNVVKLLFLGSLVLGLSACNINNIFITEVQASPNLGGVNCTGNSQCNLSVSVENSKNQIIRTGTIESVVVVSVSQGQAKPKVCQNNQIKDQGSLTAAIVLDGSGSMEDNDPQKFRNTAAKTFVSLMSSQDLASVSWFADSFHREQNLTANTSFLSSAIDRATQVDSGTALYDAISAEARTLSSARAGNRIMLLLTDGVDNRSSISKSTAISNSRATGARIYSIGLRGSGDTNFSDLQEVSSQTGGYFAQADRADQLNALFSNIYNNSVASGCIGLEFSGIQASPNTTIEIRGTLNFSVLSGSTRYKVTGASFLAYLTF